jgi:Cu(I)/Ag(I) efflux system membrane fusion protein
MSIPFIKRITKTCNYTFVSMLFISFYLSSYAKAEDSAFHNVGPYQLRAEINPETPKVGRNTILLWLLDKNGAPLRGATLSVVAVMPSMGAMPAMYAPAEMQETEPGLYQGEFQPSMGGEWPLTIEIESNAGKSKIRFDLATGRKGIRCSSCGIQSDMRGTIQVDPARRQLIGITTGAVQFQNLHVTTRAAGRITYDETRLRDVTLKFNGWIGKLYANSIGKPVTKGQPLFTVYSPDLLAAQEEYLQTRRRIKARSGKNSHSLRAVERRLRLWNLSQQQISDLAKRGKALEYVPILANTSGVIIDKQIVAGSAFRSGQRLLRLADLTQVWVEAQVYDYELPLITVGMNATVILPELQDREFSTKVDYVLPFMQGDTRTATVRVVLDNRDGFLRPDMYAHIHLKADLGKRLLVPESAVLYAGQSRIVFVDLGDGRLSPRKIKTGQRSREWIEVLQGLSEGEQVITSGNFLIAAESKLKSGIEQW